MKPHQRRPDRPRPSEAAARRRADDDALAHQTAKQTGHRPSEERPPLWHPHSKLRVEWHRATMAHLRSVYPFHADAGLGHRGPYMGISVSGGMAAFYYDPFELYPHTLTNPNAIICGQVGAGKSCTVKAFLARSLAVYGPRRYVAIIDPKGEYTPLAGALGLTHVQLRPGGNVRLNPMDGRTSDDPADTIARQSLATALVAAVLGRRLEPAEDAVLGWAIHTLATTRASFTLGDVLAAVHDPPAELVSLAQCTPLELAHAAAPIGFALDKLVHRTLRGMFDGSTTVDLDPSQSPGVVIDLSAVYSDRDALPLVLLAGTSWLTNTLRTVGDRRVIQVIDEAWAAVRHGAHHFQSSLKLARAYGISTWLLCHKPADLTAQADDGTADAKIAAGLLADIQTRILLRQPPDQIPIAADLFGLTQHQAAILGQLHQGRALWRLQGRAAVVQQVLTARERRLFDTDAAMTA